MDKISVVTVTYNNSEEFIFTLESILKQRKKGAFIELVVIDGSTDRKSYDSIYNEYAQEIDILKREPDNGIFNAMNKALDLATGDSIVFINSGDFFEDTFNLKTFQEQNDLKNNVIYTCVKMYTKNFEIVRPDVQKIKNISFSDYGHQGVYVPKDLYKKIHYDERMFYSADYYWMKDIAKENRNVFLSEVSACFSLGGVSNDYSWKNFKKYIKQPVKFNYKINHLVKTLLNSLLGEERLNYLLFRNKYVIKRR